MNSERHYLLRHRQRMPARIRKAAEKKIIDKIKRHPLIVAAKTIGLYFPDRGEVDITPLFPMFLAAEKTLAFPKVLNEAQMQFYHYDKNTLWRKNRFGIKEPDTADMIEREKIDVLLVPLLAFNGKNYRLGSGHGYYDRYLAEPIQRPFTLGIAFQSQYFPFTEKPHDIPMDEIIFDK